MKNSGKRSISYVSLIEFVNKEITAETWVKTLEKLRQHPHRSWPTNPDPARLEKASREWEAMYKGKGFPLQWELWNIRGPEPVREIQNEFRLDLERLTKQKNQDVRWLLNKIQGVIGGEKGILLQLSWSTLRTGDSRILSTDPISFVPLFSDLRQFVYFRLGKLWEDDLLHQIDHCQNTKCQRFFLAKTKRADRQYCSPQCAQDINAADRTRKSRARRATWKSVRKVLEQAMKQIQTLHQTTQRQALTQGEAALKKAKHAFQDAYLRGKGPGYDEGEQLLAQAEQQVAQLRKKVKGY